MLFLYLYSTTFQWFSVDFWINSLLHVLPIHWKSLILMNIVLNVEVSIWTIETEPLCTTFWTSDCDIPRVTERALSVEWCHVHDLCLLLEDHLNMKETINIIALMENWELVFIQSSSFSRGATWESNLILLNINPTLWHNCRERSDNNCNHIMHHRPRFQHRNFHVDFFTPTEQKPFARNHQK